MEGKAYIDQNHDKIFSFFMDFVNHGLELILVAFTGIFLNLAFVYGMAKCSEKIGIVTLFAMEFLQFIIILVFIYFALRSEGMARVAY